MATVAGTAQRRVFTVTQVTESIQRTIDRLQSGKSPYWVEGEIGEWKYYGRGDAYFTLKDETSLINCIAWAGIIARLDGASRERLSDRAKNQGLKIKVLGSVTVQKRAGRYSFMVQSIELCDGTGELMKRFLEAKAGFEAEGLFAHGINPRPLPKMPRRIGVVTSESGAVIHDICDTVFRRFPDLELRLYPAKVQGEGAAKDVARGIRYFNTCQDWRAEVLIVGRGGGSMEDLWAFNEEEVVRAVATSAIPVISAVGHQTDHTLCDDAADLRAGTPSIAAEKAVPQKIDVAGRIYDAESRMKRAFRNAYAMAGSRLKAAALKLGSAPQRYVSDFERRLERSRTALGAAALAHCERASHAIERASAKLELLNPYSTLKRGYSITLDAAGRALSDPKSVKPGDEITTLLAGGRLESSVKRAILP